MILNAEHISKSFGERKVLDDVTLTADRGEVVGLLGANGAGKTTLLRIITGLMKADSGKVYFHDRPLNYYLSRHIGYLPEERGLYRNMRAGEQVLYLLRLRGLPSDQAKRRAQDWFVRLHMEDWWNYPVGKLSKGMQQRLQFIVSVAHSPDLIVLDEPFSGFDEENKALLKREIKAIKSSGAAIVISTHEPMVSTELCDREVCL